MSLKDIAQRFADNHPSRSDLGLPAIQADADTAGDLLRLVFGVTGAIAVLMIIVITIIMVTGGNDPEKIARSKKAIIYTLIGLIIVLSAETIVLVFLTNL